MKCFHDRMLDIRILDLHRNIADQISSIDLFCRDLATLKDVLAKRTGTVDALLAETQRLYDEGGAGPEWANTLGFLRTVPASKYYRPPSAGHSDPEIAFAAARNAYDLAVDIARRIGK